jgi:hypothetical protein
MRKYLFFLVLSVFYAQSAAAYVNYTNFTYLHPVRANFSYLNTMQEESPGIDIPKEAAVHVPEDNADLRTLFTIAEELSPAVERYAFDDNATKSRLYMDVSSVLISYAVRRVTGGQFDLRLHEDRGEDNKSK